jgi:hypothetical protein
VQRRHQRWVAAHGDRDIGHVPSDRWGARCVPAGPAAAAAAGLGLAFMTTRARSPVLCTCGHDRDAHRHYRRGTDCARCECEQWSPTCWLFRLLHRWPACNGPSGHGRMRLFPGRLPGDVTGQSRPVTLCSRKADRANQGLGQKVLLGRGERICIDPRPYVYLGIASS